MENTIVKIKKMDNLKELPLPFYSTNMSAGMDLIAANEEDIILLPMARTLVPHGIAIELPLGFEAQVRPRSGLAIKHGISVLNAPGTIDPDYRGEICSILINLSDTQFVIKRGDRVSQLVIAQYNQVSWNTVEELNNTERGDNGFGSTGIASDQTAKVG